MVVDKDTDRGYAWVVVGAAFWISFLIDGVRFSFGILYAEFLDSFDSGKGDTAWIGSLLFGTVNAVAPLGGTMVKSYGCRVTAITGSVVSSAGFFMSSFAPNIYFLYFSFGIVGGVGLSLAYIAIIVAVVQYFKEKRSLACGLYLCGSGLGGFALNPLMKALIDCYTWRGCVLIVSAIVLNGAVAGALLRPHKPAASHREHGSQCLEPEPESKPDVDKTLINEREDKEIYKIITEDTNSVSKFHTETSEDVKDTCADNAEEMQVFIAPGGPEPRVSESKAPVGCRRKWRNDCSVLLGLIDRLLHFSMLKDPMFALFAVSQTILATPYFIPFTMLPERCLELGSSGSQAAWLMSGVSTTNTLFRLVTGAICDWHTISGHRPVLFLVAVLTTGLLCLLFPLFTLYPLLALYGVLYGATMGAAITLAPLVIADLYGDDIIAVTYGLFLFFRSPGSFIGPPLGGWVTEKTNRLDLAFVTAGVLFTVGGLMIIPILVHRQWLARRTR